MLLRDYGLPTWASYGLFAIVTIIIGTLVGLMLVCVIDFIWPQKPMTRQTFSQKQETQSNRSKDALTEDIIDDRGDSDEDETSEAEKISGSDEDEEEEDVKKSTPKSSPDVRKRRTRKAD
jgi:predicted Holliday junction resolvase-like endonuclease